MCGIFGFFHLDPSKTADGAKLEPMGAVLTHRGPDDSGELVDRYMALGHKRLSIIDLSPQGRQPMANEEKTVWLVFNGEIYNFKDFIPELKSKGHIFSSQTDSEVLIHLYEEYGIDYLNRLDGMYAFVLWDKKNDEVFLVRDHIGIKPLHYAEANGQLIFGSEIKALLKHPDISPELDYEALNDYLSFEYVPAPRSIFKNIRKILPGHYLCVKKGAIKSVGYWQTRDIEPGREKHEEEYAEELEEILKNSVRRQLVSDVALGAFLSGGIDSSSVCALMQAIAPGNVHSFNISFEETSYDESRHAKLVAKHLGTHHREDRLSIKKTIELVPQVMNYLDEPFGDASFFPTLLLSQFTRRHVKVSLSGDGGDELFAGYPTYPAHRFARPYAAIPSWLSAPLKRWLNRLPVAYKNFSLDFKIKKFISAAHVPSLARRHYLWMGSFAPEEKKELLRPDILNFLGTQDPFLIVEKHYQERQSKDWLEKILFCDQRFYLQDDMLVKVDRASMAASLEARVPFLSPEMIRFAGRLPARLKLKGLTTKYILKKTMKKFLPPAIIDRPKKGFGIPLNQWFRAELRPLLEDLLAPAKIKREGIFSPETVSRLVREHLAGTHDHRKKLYTLVNFELWREKYLISSA